VQALRQLAAHVPGVRRVPQPVHGPQQDRAAAVGAGLEIPNAVITSVQGERVPSVVVRERVIVGEPLPAEVELRPVPHYTQYDYAIVNDRRVIVEPRTRKVIRIID